ncbi:MAG: hypothetical protein HUU46_09705 [Candidatus Hydrogenedentes bacterium]|nr:hypothetical protein [Candidatus Hydrogenedentota bacterium]
MIQQSDASMSRGGGAGTAADNAGPARRAASGKSAAREWKLVGRVRSNFIDQMKQFEYCPADITYNVYDPEAHWFAKEFGKAMAEAGWNVTVTPESKNAPGIKILTKSSALHAEEITSVVKWLRTAGLNAKVRVRSDLETEAIQISIGSINAAAREP